MTGMKEMFIETLLKCENCNSVNTIKSTDKFISIKCNCKCLILNEKNKIKIVGKDEYDPDYKIKN